MAKISQIYDLTNKAVQEAVGDAVILEEDLTNIVEVGKTITDANALDKYVNALVNHIGKVVIAHNRKYRGFAPTILRDGWEFGSMLERIDISMPEATENEVWALNPGQSYDNGTIFLQPSVSATFFNKRTTFDIDMSFATRQVRDSFSNATQLGAFVGGIETKISNSIDIRLSELAKRLVNSIILDTVYDDFGSNSISGASHVKAVNLLYEFNNGPNYGQTALTAANCLWNDEFIKFASYRMAATIDYLKEASSLYNIAGKVRFTNPEDLNVVLLSDFRRAADAYLQSTTFHEQYTALPDAETVAAWQGTDDNVKKGGVAARSKIDAISGGNHNLTVTGVLGVMFDKEALAICNQDNRVNTAFNPNGEFYTEYWKVDCEYLQNNDENCVVFFVA